MTSDHWKTLGVDRGADASEIKAAYIRLAKQWHPDRNRGREEESTRVFSRVTAAYSVLSDPDARREYSRSTAEAAASAEMDPGPHVRRREQFGRDMAAEAAVMDFPTFLRWLAEVVRVGLDAVLRGVAHAAKQGTAKVITYAGKVEQRHEQALDRWTDRSLQAAMARSTVAHKTIPLRVVGSLMGLAAFGSCLWRVPHTEGGMALRLALFFGCLVGAVLLHLWADSIQKKVGGTEPRRPTWFDAL